MELKEQAAKIKELLQLDDYEKMPNKLLELLLEGGEKVEELKALIDGEILRSLYQFYLAKRDKKHGQDFTLPSLADMVAALGLKENTKVVYDMCAGSGALTLACFRANKNLQFICDEFDKDVIPFLLFNLYASGINAIVRQGNVLTGEYERFFIVNADGVREEEEVELPKMDVAVSNPPYNVRNDEGLANFQFVKKALEKVSRAVFLLPNGVTTSSQEQKYRTELLPFYEAHITIPGGVFESTNISIATLLFDKSHTMKEKVRYLDARMDYFVDGVREQRGEGGIHYHRVYKKVMKVLPPERITDMLTKGDMVDKSQLQENWHYLPQYVPKEEVHRPYNDIIDDLNYWARKKGSIKLTINEKVMRDMNMELCTEDNEFSWDEHNEMFRKNGYKELEHHRYITPTKSAVIKFECKTNEGVPILMVDFLRFWAYHLQAINEEENRYLIEMRDALIPDLIDGKLEM